MIYLEFTKYQEIGGKLKELEFNRAAMTVCSKIDNMTFNRLRPFFDDLPADNHLRIKIEYLIFELIERELCGSLDGKEVTSESNNGTSYSYESKNGKAASVIREYLGNEKDQRGIPLLYAGNI
jgi:hypothetical protein